jgi:2-hydroxy-4-carboxymuconate semialdehyde hemiacetal dehydrogenase
MKLALIGHGAMATEHLRALITLGVQPYVVAGIFQAEVEHFGREHGFRHSTTDVEAALTDSEVDVVIIASPNDQHYPQARTAIDAGKNVLIEIPIALSGQDARDLAERAEASGRTVMAGHISRYYPALRELREQIISRKSRFHHLIAAMGTDKRTNRNWKGEPRTWIDNLLWHHGLHVIDVALWLHDHEPVAAVSAQAGRRHPEHGGDMDLSVSVRFTDGALATIALTYHAPDQFTRYTFISDDQMLDYQQGSPQRGPDDLMKGGLFQELVLRQDGGFLDACRQGGKASIPIDSVVPAMQLLDQIQLHISEQRRAEESS